MGSLLYYIEVTRRSDLFLFGFGRSVWAEGSASIRIWGCVVSDMELSSITTSESSIWRLGKWIPKLRNREVAVQGFSMDFDKETYPS